MSTRPFNQRFSFDRLVNKYNQPASQMDYARMQRSLPANPCAIRQPGSGPACLASQPAEKATEWE
jgi:hypothetical protein